MAEKKNENTEAIFTLPLSTEEASEVWALSRDDAVRRKRAWIQVQNIMELIPWKLLN